MIALIGAHCYKKKDVKVEAKYKKTERTTSSFPSSLSITLSRSLSTDISARRHVYIVSVENNPNNALVASVLMWLQLVTVTGEVAESNVLLFHKGLGANQIGKRPVHIEILKRNVKNRKLGLSLRLRDKKPSVCVKTRLGLQDGLHSVCDLLVLWVRVSCFDVQMLEGRVQDSQTVIYSFLHLRDQLGLFLLPGLLLRGKWNEKLSHSLL